MTYSFSERERGEAADATAGADKLLLLSRPRLQSPVLLLPAARGAPATDGLFPGPSSGCVPEPSPPARPRYSRTSPAQEPQVAEDCKMLASTPEEGVSRGPDVHQPPVAEVPAPPWSRLIALPPHSDIGVINLRDRIAALGKDFFKSTAQISADARIRFAAHHHMHR